MQMNDEQHSGAQNLARSFGLRPKFRHMYGVAPRDNPWLRTAPSLARNFEQQRGSRWKREQTLGQLCNSITAPLF